MKNVRLIPVTPPLLDGTDLLYVIKVLLGLDEVNLNQVREKFKTLFNRKYVLFVNSGRAAIKLILTSLSLPSDAEVLIPAYTCIVVPNAVHSSGYNIRFVDIDELKMNVTLQTLEKAYTKKAKVLILTHMFGYMSQTDAILSWAKKKGLFVIEDVALALGSMYKNQPAGSFGDISITSFNIGKHITSFGGGLLSTDNKQLFTRLNNELDQAPVMNDGFKYVMKITFYQILFNTSIYPWAYGIIKKFKALKHYQNPISTDYIEKVSIMNMSKLRLALIASQLQRLNSIILARQKLFTYFETAFSKTKGIQLIQRDRNCLPSPSHFSFLVKKDRIPQIIDYGNNSGIRYGRVFDYVCPSTAAYNVSEKFPHSQKLADQIVNIPFYPRLSQSDRAYIVSKLLHYFGEK